MPTPAELSNRLQVAKLLAAAGTASVPLGKELAQVDTLLVELGKQIAANAASSEAKVLGDTIERMLGSVMARASAAACPAGPAVKGSRIAWIGASALVAVFVGVGLFTWWYVSNSSTGVLGTIAGTRPLLVVAAITSTIAFGGAMLIGSIFSNDGAYEDRIRHAREIFLVFSGIFGTVVGFYFGADDGKGTVLEVDSTIEGAQLVAHISGGKPPYDISVPGYALTRDSKDNADGWLRLTLAPTPASNSAVRVVASDSKGLAGVDVVTIAAKAEPPTPPK